MGFAGLFLCPKGFIEWLFPTVTRPPCFGLVDGEGVSVPLNLLHDVILRPCQRPSLMAVGEELGNVRVHGQHLKPWRGSGWVEAPSMTRVQPNRPSDSWAGQAWPPIPTKLVPRLSREGTCLLTDGPIFIACRQGHAKSLHGGKTALGHRVESHHKTVPMGTNVEAF